MTNAQERKAQERQARRRRIQEAARSVFAERGYQGASIELIARAAQLSVGAIYLYFRSKEDLYVSLIEDAMTVFDVEMAQVREHSEVGKRLRRRGHQFGGIRLDSGDLAYLSLEARKLLNAAGFNDAIIVGSNDLNEHLIANWRWARARMSSSVGKS